MLSFFPRNPISVITATKNRVILVKLILLVTSPGKSASEKRRPANVSKIKNRPSCKSLYMTKREL